MFMFFTWQGTCAPTSDRALVALDVQIFLVTGERDDTVLGDNPGSCFHLAFLEDWWLKNGKMITQGPLNWKIMFQSVVTGRTWQGGRLLNLKLTKIEARYDFRSCLQMFFSAFSISHFLQELLPLYISFGFSASRSGLFSLHFLLILSLSPPHRFRKTIYQQLSTIFMLGIGEYQ